MVFWGCLFLAAHTYVLYPCVLFVAYAVVQAAHDLRYLGRRRDRRRADLADDQLPGVTLLVPAYNEDAHLERKLENVRALDYPRDRLQVIFVSDGSTDRTNEMLGTVTEAWAETLLLPERGGKAHALNAAVARARHEILIFSDASTLFAPDAIRRLVRHFVDPTVGVACGTLTFTGNAEHGQTEGVYWGYEIMLRLMEARLGATLTASGAIYAARRACYRPLTAADVIDDFVVPMHARQLGYRIVFDPEAQALEFAAASVEGEFRRRARIAVGSFRALGRFSRVPMGVFASFSFFSHKVLRWVLPFLMLGVFASNALLLGRPFYRAVFAAQLAFYGWATLGFLLRERIQKIPYALLAYFLVAINVAYLVGFFRFVGGRSETAWQRVR